MKNSIFKKAFTAIIELSINNWRQLILFILIITLTSRAAINYYTPISYEISEIFSDSIIKEKPFEVSAYLKIKFSTRQAFLPYEKIRVEISYYPCITKSYENAKFASLIEFIFPEAYLTDNKINKTKDAYNYEQENNLKNLKYKFVEQNPAVLKLHSSDENDSLFYCEYEIFYKNQGDHNINYTIGKDIGVLPTKVQIGSSIDLNNKKTNDLIYILTAVNLMFLFYTEFLKKSLPCKNDSKKPS